MKAYIVTAYRWGYTNAHQYIVGVYNNSERAIKMADEEAEGRGGKYGCEVEDFEGEKRESIYYTPSIYGEEKASHNYRIDMFEKLGHLLYERADGRARYVTNDNFVKWKKIKPAKWIKEAVKKEEEFSTQMNKMMEEIPKKTSNKGLTSGESVL